MTPRPSAPLSARALRPQARELAPPASGCLHVWRVDLAAAGEGLLRLLSEEERERAVRIISARRARLWSHARAALRALLGGYLACDPGTVTLIADRNGKPALDAGSASYGGPAARHTRDLRFNMSHSGEVALVAFSAGEEVGVDVEVARRRLDAAALAARAFGAAHSARLRELEGADREREFLRLWVRREASLKCLGTRPSDPRFNGEAQQLLHPRPWLAELDVGPCGAAAVAMRREPRELRYFNWRPASAATKAGPAR